MWSTRYTLPTKFIISCYIAMCALSYRKLILKCGLRWLFLKFWKCQKFKEKIFNCDKYLAKFRFWLPTLIKWIETVKILYQHADVLVHAQCYCGGSVRAGRRRLAAGISCVSSLVFFYVLYCRPRIRENFFHWLISLSAVVQFSVRCP